ncbi:MAG: permease [Verrucomicrobiota bacterium]
MDPIKKPGCCCNGPTGDQPGTPSVVPSLGWYKYFLRGFAALVVWWLVYGRLSQFAGWFTYDLIGLKHGLHLSAAMEFFVFEVPKVLMLLVLVVFAVGIIRSFFTPERTRRILSGKREFAGNILAALLGIVTPFCSCSAVPLFIGFVTTGVPLGVTFSFLISAPMVNEIALVLLFGLFGWKVAAIYLSTGLLIALVAGWIIGRLRMERHVEEWVYATQTGAATEDTPLTWPERFQYGWDAVRDIVGRVWFYVVLGIAIGAGIHGYVPEGMLASVMGKGAWWSVPVAVVMGVPMYSNAAGIIPVVQALLGKGAALGTVLAFMMSVIGLSAPEAVILRKVLKWPLIFTFFGVVAAGIVLIGYLFNFIM